MLYGNSWYIIIENFPQKFSPCNTEFSNHLYFLPRILYDEKYTYNNGKTFRPQYRYLM